MWQITLGWKEWFHKIIWICKDKFWKILEVFQGCRVVSLEHTTALWMLRIWPPTLYLAGGEVCVIPDPVAEGGRTAWEEGWPPALEGGCYRSAFLSNALYYFHSGLSLPSLSSPQHFPWFRLGKLWVPQFKCIVNTLLWERVFAIASTYAI